METSNASSVLDQHTQESLVNVVINEIQKDLAKSNFQCTNKTCNQYLCLLTALLKFNVSLNDEIDTLIDLYADNLLKDPHNFSLQNGYSGLIFRLIELYEVNKEVRYLKKAFEYCGLIEHKSIINSKYVDDSLYQGRAGVLLMLIKLNLARPAEKLLAMIDAYFRAILMNGLPLQSGLSWEGPQAATKDQLPTLSNGLSGIVYVFGTLYKVTKQEAFAFIEQKTWDHLENLVKQNEIQAALSINEKAQEYWSGLVFAYGMKSEKINQPELINSTLIAIANTAYGNDSSAEGIPEKNRSRDKKEYINDLFLHLSLLEKRPVHPSFPYINGERKMSFKRTKMTSLDEVKTIFLKKKYPKAAAFLERKTDLAAFVNPDTLDLNVPLLRDKFRFPNAKQERLFFRLLDYETLYWRNFVEHYNNPNTQERYITQLRTNIDKLRLSHRDLLKKQFILNKSFKTFDYFNTSGDQITMNSKVYWRDTMTGMEEVPLSFLSFFTRLFKNGANVETGMLKMMLICYCLPSKVFKPLIEFSESGNKKNLIARIPFLFIYQVRLLVAEGILVEQQREGIGLQKKLLTTVCKGLGIYSGFENKVFDKRA